jgi:hypothetical protein
MSDTGSSLSMQDLPINNFADVCKMERQNVEVSQIHKYNEPFLRRIFNFCCHYLSLYFSCINNNLPCEFLQHMQIARNLKYRIVQGDSFGTRPKKMRISQRLIIIQFHIL